MLFNCNASGNKRDFCYKPNNLKSLKAMKKILRLLPLILILLLISNLSVAQKTVKFHYNAFKDTKKLLLRGNAKFLEGGIRLTEAEPYQRGACWYRKRVAVEKGFTVNFTIKMSKADIELGGADGIAFVIQNDPRKLGLGQFGEGMGYAGLQNCLVVEFDTYDNDEGSDNHVSVQTNGKGKVSRFEKHTISINHKIIQLKNRTRNIKISYRKKILRVYINDRIAIKKRIDLSKKIKFALGKAWVGFTSSTAKAFSRQEILDWKWESNTIPIAISPPKKWKNQVGKRSFAAILRRKINWG